MIILGIDPGYAIVGCGVIDYSGNRFSVREYTAVTTPAGTDFSRRLEMVYDGVIALIERHRPQALAIEKLYFNNNITTGIPVAEARGCILLAAQKMGVPIYEYTPQQIKQGVTGYGKAEKKQVIEMTRMLLRLDKAPSPDDVADALAVAICHAHVSGSLLGRLRYQED
ncbi:MAG: crossover junction endodeoxyribonuclease RuvC [Firmicutes bacterium]|nr:crossover junction endodeoxyribonuclease RuvC [Bacillota bacterium]